MNVLDKIEKLRLDRGWSVYKRNQFGDREQ